MNNDITVLYEDNHLIAINKKAGDISQGDKTKDPPLAEFIKQYLKEKYNKPGNVFLGVVHRLDRPVSGAIIFAKTSKALSRLNEMMRKNEMQKTYWAVVKNLPENPKAELIHFLKKNETANKSFAYNKEIKNAKQAILNYNLIASINNYHLLEVKPATGRHHQIRVQLAAINCPIKGDVKYGFDRGNEDGSIHLHARKIELMHPVKNEMISIIAPPPTETVWSAF